MVQIRKAEVETGHREQMYGHQGEKRSEMNWETAIDMYVLTMIKQIIKEPKRNSAQCSVVTQMGGGIYVYVWLYSRK